MTEGPSPQSSGSLSEADRLVAERWQAEFPEFEALCVAGMEHVKAGDLEAAAGTYEEGIMHVLSTSDFLPVALLSNIAAAALLQNDLQTAFLYAGAVSGLPHTPLSAKAYYRAVSAASDSVGALWPLTLIQITKCMGQRSSGSQQIITEKVAEIDRRAIAPASIEEMAAGGFEGDLCSGIQALFGERLSQSAVHVLHNMHSQPVAEHPEPPDDFGRSLTHALCLKQAGNDAFL